MTTSGTRPMGSAHDTGLYVIDQSDLVEIEQDLVERDPQAPPAPRLDRAEVPREVRFRVSMMVSADDFEPPKLPEIAVEILRRAEATDDSAEEMAGLIHRDPFLAGRLLAAANSAMFRPRDRAITRLPEAIARLGRRQVRNIVLAAAMEQTVYRGPHKEMLAEQWRASLGAAVGCRLVNALTRRDADQAFMLGLLHDVGKPVLVRCLDEVLDRQGLRTHVDYEELARPILHLLHPRVGALIVTHWKLPRGLASVIAHHHDRAPPEEHQRWFCTLRIANLLYECWRDSPEDFDEGGMLEANALLARSIRDPDTIRRLLNIYPMALETLLVG